ncbi:MAG: hypothetical protein Q8K00_20475 [Syntrophales bacterium]|nr:hypothetical protein [Syntrophales bacterium]
MAFYPACSELFPGICLHGKGGHQEANNKTIQKKWTAAPGNIEGALV